MGEHILLGKAPASLWMSSNRCEFPENISLSANEIKEDIMKSEAGKAGGSFLRGCFVVCVPQQCPHIGLRLLSYSPVLLDNKI